MNKSHDLSCEHSRTHVEDVFVDLEDDGTLSYDKMEVCDNCGESWCIGDFSDNGETLGKQMGIPETLSKIRKVNPVRQP